MNDDFDDVHVKLKRSTKDDLSLAAEFYARKSGQRPSIGNIIMAILNDDPAAVLSLEEARWYRKQGPGEFKRMKR